MQVKGDPATDELKISLDCASKLVHYASMKSLSIVLLLAASVFPAQPKVQFVTVDDDVKLEVLDWGGDGPAIVLLPGYNTAHAFDDIAPKFAQFAHVYGITRRGYGVSSQPASGYSAQRRSADVLNVLDTLKLERPFLAGHSFGGEDITTLAATYPSRIAGLIYLNSAEDPTLVMSDYGVKSADPAKLPASMRQRSPEDRSSPRAYSQSQQKIHGVAFPVSEWQNSFAMNPDGSLGRHNTPGSIRQAIFEGRQKPEYARIRVPILAFFAQAAPLQEIIDLYKPQNAGERQALEQQYAVGVAIMNRHKQDLVIGAPHTQVIDVPGANFYIFLSNETEIVHGIKQFLSAAAPR